MTVDTTGGGNLPATVSDGYDTGLEDLDASDFVIPRLQIQHKEGKFKDNLSNEIFDSLDLVVLGLVKQRIMWAPTVDEGDKPMCKSPNFDIGFPAIEGTKGKTFPWERSNFNPDVATVNPTIGGVQINTNGHPVLPCGSCKFKEWETHPNGKNPWCSEQHTLPVMYRRAGTDGEFITALLTLQKTGITPSKRYLTSFARSQTPAYTALTRISLRMLTRGDTVYSVPEFSRIGDTDRADWPEYAESFKSIREFVRSAPRPKDDETEDTTDNGWGAPPEGAAAAPAPTANEDPWASTQASAPAAAAPAATAPQPAPGPVQPAPTPPPAPEPTVQVPTAPVAPSPAPTPPPAAPAPAATAPPVEVPASTVPAATAPADDSDLPF